MREIVMDTETTGLDPQQGDRIVEIGGVELENHLPTGRVYHQYINPERSMPKEAFEVHGLGDEFLRDKPVFSRIAQEFLDFVGDAKLVIHNASFDMAFINAELGWLGRPPLPMSQAIDTLDIARRKFPGAQASLDALCKRFGVDNSGREKHGALLDSEILAEVYLELLGGRQHGLTLERSGGASASAETSGSAEWTAPPRPSPLPSRLTESEKAAHAAFVEEMGDAALWRSA
jgi:DNA polymerase-3 subunit epsilon